MSKRYDDSLDGWPDARLRIASVAHLQALGQITLIYNHCEKALKALFLDCAPTARDFAEAMFNKQGNRDRVEMLSAFVRANEMDNGVKEAILYFLRCYEICTANRNILMHATVVDSDPTTIRLTKAAAKNPAREIHFHVPLTQLRLVADQMAETWIYGLKLRLRVTKRRRPEPIGLGIAAKPAVPLPDRPPKPRKLTPYQPAKAPKAAPPSPESFRG